MGMFDWVKYEMECPNCGEKVKRFQSKDKACVLEELDYWEVDNFYTDCNKCKTWIEFFIKKSVRQKIPIEDYQMIIGEENKPT